MKMISNHICRITFLFIVIFSLYPGETNSQEFVNPLLIPELIESDRTDYHLNVIETKHNFNPFGSDSLNTQVTTFAFEDADNPGNSTILGPTIAWQFGNIVHPRVTNTLDERTTTHWHGAHVPTYADGGPHQIIQPGDTWNPTFTVLDESATMWYHPHAMDLTYEHVQMGLSGMIYVEDPIGKDSLLTAIHELLPTEYGVNDYPLIIQTKKFVRNQDNGEIEILENFGFKDGYVYMVNGRKDPFLEVPNEMVRLRVLNGDGKFTFNLGIGDKENLTAEGFQMIATDAGYMDKTYAKDEVFMSPGERTEWLVDFSKYDIGDSVFLYNKVSELDTGLIGSTEKTEGYAQDRALLKFVITDKEAPQSNITSFPIELQPLKTPPISQASRNRVKELRLDDFEVNGKMKKLFSIDSVLMNMQVVNDTVLVDSTEVWTIKNNTGIGHPWHIHDIHFWVIDAKDADGNPVNPEDYPEIFNGPKDNVLVRPFWELSYIATFNDFGTQIRFDSTYMYHCHILPHEDRGMMGQFVVWNGKTPTSVDEKQLEIGSLEVFPNPARNSLYIKGNTQGISQLQIFSADGKLVKTERIPAFTGSHKINLPKDSKGIYFLKWTQENTIRTAKVVLE